MKKSYRELLELLADGRFHSGTQLGDALSVSRTAIWQRISQLREYGLPIFSVKGKGHRLASQIELFDEASIRTALSPAARSELTSIQLFSELDSTSSYLLERVDKQKIHACVILSEYQNAGRGRRGRRWFSPYASGICLSIGWHFISSPEPLAVISLGSGVAIVRTLRAQGVSEIGLKWPNDILVDGRKLGGVLVEISAESAGPCHAVIGIGLNFRVPDGEVTDIDQPWTDIYTVAGRAVSRNAYTAKVIDEVFDILSEIRRGNMRSILDEWRSYDCFRGKEVQLTLPNRIVTGRVVNVDDGGALILKSDGQLRKYNIGEISMRVQQ